MGGRQPSKSELPPVVTAKDVDRVERALYSIPPDEALYRVEKLLMLLRVPNILKILLAVEQDLCLSDARAVVNKNYSYVSRICNDLKRAGLVTSRRVGPNVYFKSTNNLATDIIRLLVVK